MGLRDFLHRLRPGRDRAPDDLATLGDTPAPPDPADLRARWEQMLRGALTEAEGGDEISGQAPAVDPRVAALHARARELQARISAAMTREETLAQYQGCDDVGDDVTLADLWGGPSSSDLTDDLGLLYLSDPAAFDVPEFAYLAAHDDDIRTALLGRDRSSERAAGRDVEQAWKREGQRAGEREGEGDPADTRDTRDVAEVRTALDRDNAELIAAGLEPTFAPEGADLDQLDYLRMFTYYDLEDLQREREAAENQAWVAQRATSMTRPEAADALARAQEYAEHRSCNIAVERCAVCSEMEDDDAYDARRAAIDAARIAAEHHGWDPAELRREAIDRGHPGDRTRMRDEHAEHHAAAHQLDPAPQDPATEPPARHQPEQREHGDEEPEL